MWTNRVLKETRETAFDPNVSAYAIVGENIYLPNKLTAEESAGLFAENFFLCVRDEIPEKGEEAMFAFITQSCLPIHWWEEVT